MTASKQRAPVPKCFINKQISDLHVLAYCDQWQYGTWQNKTACLMVLEFQFIPGFRLKRAEIELTFRPFVPDATVAIEAFGPAQLEGSKTTNTLSQKQTFTSSLSGGAAGVSLGVGLNGEHGSSYDKIWHGFIEGDSSVKADSELGGKKNHIIWYLREDPLHSLGVPSRFRPAVIVTYEGTFELDCVIKLDNGVLGKHWWQITRNITLLVNRTLNTTHDDSPILFGSYDKGEIPILHEPALNGPAIGEHQDQQPLRAAAQGATGAAGTTVVPARYTPHFDQITLGQWERIWKCRWSENTSGLDPNTTIYDYLHNTAVVSVSSATVPVQTPIAPAKTNNSEQPPAGPSNIGIECLVRGSRAPTEIQPTQIQSSQTQPTQTQPTQIQPSQIQPSQIQPSQIQSSQIQPIVLPNITISNTVPLAKRRFF